MITTCDYCETQVEINMLGHATHIDIEQDDHEPELSF
jgi:hypothetical protein